MSFGIGYAAHKLMSHSEVKEYVVAPLIEYRGRSSGTYEAMNIKSMKTYSIYGINIPKEEYGKISNMRYAKVKIDSRVSLFGTSFPNDFEFKSVEQEH